jgi:hypothetical protein
MDNDSWFWIGLAVGSVLVLAIYGSVLIFSGDEQDIINVKDFGQELCKTYNLEYDYRDFTTVTVDDDNTFTRLRIHCKEYHPIIDGVVVKD